MNKYIVTWRAGAGEIWRADPDWQTVAFLHCGEVEARIIAEDLGARFVKDERMLAGIGESVPQYHYSDDCPNNCDHARRYAFPELTWAS